MPSTSQRSITFPRITVTILLIIVLVWMSGGFHAHGIVQTTQDKLLSKVSYANEPLKIKAIKTKKGSIDLGNKFLDKDDWLEGLTFNVENISGKSIAFIELELEFPKSDDTAPLIYSIYYGQPPPAPDQPAAPGAPPLVQPGKTIKIGFLEAQYTDLRTLLEMEQYPSSIKQVVLRIRKVIFDDDTMWNTGQLMVRDPDNPKLWIPAKRLKKSASTRKTDSLANHVIKDGSDKYGSCF